MTDHAADLAPLIAALRTDAESWREEVPEDPAPPERSERWAALLEEKGADGVDIILDEATRIAPLDQGAAIMVDALQALRRTWKRRS